MTTWQQVSRLMKNLEKGGTPEDPCKVAWHDGGFEFGTGLAACVNERYIMIYLQIQIVTSIIIYSFMYYDSHNLT